MKDENLNNYLSDALCVLEEHRTVLESQLEAQKNLEKLIPENLERNLNSLKTFFPQLYNKFQNYELKKQYKLTCNENRQPNILFPDGSYLYGNNPFDECKKQVDNLLNNLSFSVNAQGIAEEDNPFYQLHFYYKNKLYSQVKDLCAKNNTESQSQKRGKITSAPLLIMLGLGLGYQLAFLYEKFTPVNIYIIEPDTDLFYLSLCVLDYAYIFEYISERHLGIKFIFTDDPESIMLDLDNYCSKYGMNIAVKTFYQHYASPRLSEIRHRLERDLPSISIKNGFFDDTLTGMCHSYRNLIAGVRILTDYQIPEKLLNIPALIIGSGPSLDDELELIKRINSRVCIIACGTALTALIRYGIKVDIYVAIERTESVRDSLLTITDRSVFDQILCIAPDIVHPEVLDLFKHKLIGLKANEVLPSLLVLSKKLNNIENLCCLNYCNPLVSNMGLFIASYLGFKNLFLVGVDNGSVKNESHSIYTCYYDERGNIKNGSENMILNKLPLSYPGNFRTTVKTNTLFKLSIRIFEELISNFKEKINFYNASDGAKIEGAIPLHLSEMDWSKYSSFNHDDLRNEIISNKSKSIDVSKIDFQSLLKCDRYNEVADQLIKDLQTLPEDRVEVVLRLEAHLDYLREIKKEGLIAGCCALYGSLCLMYAGLLTAIYCTNSSNKELANIIETITDFISETKRYYSHAFEYDYEYIRNNVKR